MSVGLWVALGTTIATVVFSFVGGLAYAWYVLERWIDDDDSYARVSASVEGSGR